MKDRWRIEERLGKGTFCELHRASDLTKKTEGAAVKVEVQGMQRSVLKVLLCAHGTLFVVLLAVCLPAVGVHVLHARVCALFVLLSQFANTAPAHRLTNDKVSRPQRVKR